MRIFGAFLVAVIARRQESHSCRIRKFPALAGISSYLGRWIQPFDARFAEFTVAVNFYKISRSEQLVALRFGKVAEL
jgi:hypothetical protein